MARISKYDTNVKPHLQKIKKWVAAGATAKEIADALDIAESTLHKYKTEKKELSDAFARGNANVICNIKAALYKKATGFYYEETKTWTKEDANGGITTYNEKYNRYCVPSETAAAMMLRNIDDDWHDNDNTSVKLKQQENDLKRKLAAANNFIDLGEGGS